MIEELEAEEDAVWTVVETILPFNALPSNHLYPNPLFARQTTWQPQNRFCQCIHSITKSFSIHLPTPLLLSATQDNLPTPQTDSRTPQTSVLNLEVRKFHHVPTAEQFLETKSDPLSLHPIHPYLAPPPWKHLRTSSLCHNYLTTPFFIQAMLRNRAPLSPR